MEYSIKIYESLGFLNIENLDNIGNKISIQINNRNNLTRITKNASEDSTKGYLTLSTFGSLEVVFIVGNPYGGLSDDIISYVDDSNIDISPNGLDDLENYIINLL